MKWSLWTKDDGNELILLTTRSMKGPRRKNCRNTTHRNRRTSTLIAYRIAYGIVLGVLLGNVLRTAYAAASATVSALLIASAVLLCCVFGLLIGFSRIPPGIFWILVLAWEALFIWYAWFSPTAPFGMHELHTLEMNAAASESTTHYLKAGALFAALFGWFLSLPITRMALKSGARQV